MKNKFFFATILSMIFLACSCSNDEDFEIQEVGSNNFKTKQLINFKKKINQKKVDSLELQVNGQEIFLEGDPSNPKPPKS
jgi:hypothetical protein